MSKFKVGDRVKDLKGKVGMVICIDMRHKYPIKVEYEDRTTSYATDGRLYTGDDFPDIELLEPKTDAIPFPLQVGDVVDYGGLQGTVVDVYNNSLAQVAEVISINKRRTDFYLDGTTMQGQTKPVVTIVSRPKKKVKKKLEGWVNIYKDGHCLYPNKESADRTANKDVRVACVKVTGEYEVEE